MTAIPQIKRVYYSITFLHWFATALPLALSILLMQARGVSLLQIGVLNGLYALTIVLLELPTGGLADSVGRKPVQLMSYGFMVLSGSVFLFAFSFIWYLLAFVLMGVSRALSSGALDAWFVDSLLAVDAELKLQPYLAQAEMVSITGLMLGTLLGGIIPRAFTFLPADGTAVFTPLAMTLVGMIVLKLITAIMVITLVKEPRVTVKNEKEKTQGIQALTGVIKDALTLATSNPVVLLVMLGGFISAFGLTSIETFWQPQFATLISGEPDSVLFGLLMTGAFLLGVCGNLISIPITKRLNNRYGLVAALFQALSGLSLLVLSLQTQAPYAAGLFWMYYFSIAVKNSPVATIINDAIPSHRRSSMQSIVSLSSFAGGFSGSFLIGMIAEHNTIATAWLLTGTLLLTSTIIFLRIEQLREKHRNKHATATLE